MPRLDAASVKDMPSCSKKSKFSIALAHISDSSNKMADLLPHLQVDTFHQMLPNSDQCSTKLTPPPPEVWDI